MHIGVAGVTVIKKYAIEHGPLLYAIKNGLFVTERKVR